jgi:predicted  nucleic acid-binding Zn-ribbon protein
MSENKLESIVENTPKKESYEVSLGGFKLKLNNTMIAMAIPLLSALGGTLWGAFEFYQDYMNMKAKIQKYVAPDLSEFDKRLAVIEENSAKTTDYTRDIKNDLKGDIRRNESVTEQIERSVKQVQRETESEMRGMRKDVREDLEKARTEAAIIRSEMEKTRKEINTEMNQARREIGREVEQLKKEVDTKIQKAMDNPLAK